MSPETDLITLYSGRILALAADVPRIGRLEKPDGTSRRRAPQCGSTVTVDVRVADGRISDFAQDVRACALGQAAAAVVGAEAVGRSLAELRTAQDALHAMLASGGPPPGAPFAELGVLEAARGFTNRHASICLALDATVEAMESALAHAAG